MKQIETKSPSSQKNMSTHYVRKINERVYLLDEMIDNLIASDRAEKLRGEE